MNHDLSKYRFSTLDIVHDGTQEVPIDSDLTLPDYCPDVGKILKCQISSGVLSRNISGDLLTVEGISVLELFYSDLEKNTIRCFKTDIPFSQNINIKNSCESSVATFDTKREYINCRAISPRRIDVHGAFSLKIKVFGSKNAEVTNDISSDEIRQKKSDVSFSQLSSLLQHQININEILDLGSEKSTPEFILKSNVSISDLECKSESERINLKGKINTKILYINDIETGKIDSVDYEIPINEVIDAPNVTDDSTFMIIPEIISHDEKISSESDGLSNLINENVKIMVTLLSFQDDETKIIDDAYSTQHETELCYESFDFKKNLEPFSEFITCKENLNNNENKFFKILDIWPCSKSANLFEKDSSFGVEGKINLCVLAIDPDFVPFYFEREVNFSKSFYNNLNVKNFDPYIFISIPQIDYKVLNNDSIEVKLNIQVTVNICEKNKKKIVESITSNESDVKKDENAALTIYYANAGETIWDIAKKYGTTVEKIQDENEIECDVLESDKAILIPTVSPTR